MFLNAPFPPISWLLLSPPSSWCPEEDGWCGREEPLSPPPTDSRPPKPGPPSRWCASFLLMTLISFLRALARRDWPMLCLPELTSSRRTCRKCSCSSSGSRRLFSGRSRSVRDSETTLEKVRKIMNTTKGCRGRQVFWGWFSTKESRKPWLEGQRIRKTMFLLVFRCMIDMLHLLVKWLYCTFVSAIYSYSASSSCTYCLWQGIYYNRN